MKRLFCLWGGYSPFIYAHQDGFYAIQGGLIGFVSPSNKDERSNSYPIARADRIQGSVVFHEAFAKFRCLIPSDGFYVWDKKKPYLVRLKTQGLFAIAGIFSRSLYHDPLLVTFALLTTFPNGLVAEVHHRMLAVLRPEHEAPYLDPDTPLKDVADMLLPIDENEMEMYPVSPRLTAATNNSPDFVRSLNESAVWLKDKDDHEPQQLSLLD